jgi:hypothetical protein
MLLEVGIEAEHFTVVLEPWRLNSWNVVIFWGISFFLEGGVVETFSHLIDEVFVDYLFIELPLLLLGSIDEIELLCLVVVLLVGIMKDVAW